MNDYASACINVYMLMYIFIYVYACVYMDGFISLKIMHCLLIN